MSKISPSLDPTPVSSRRKVTAQLPDQPKPWRCALKFALISLAIGLLAGVLATIDQLGNLPAQQYQKLMAAAGSQALFVAVSTAQIGIYVFIAGLFGHVLAGKTGLLKSWRLSSKPLLIALGAGAGAGIFISLDKWTFSRWIPQLRELTQQLNSARATGASSTSFGVAFGKPALDLVAQMLYGGFVEEILVRLFLMSLFAWIVWKVLGRKNPVCPTFALVVGNILAAAFFAAGHLPATYLMLGALTPLIIVRTFLFNGAVGLLFGLLYRKYGLQYAMIAHAFTHLVAGAVLALL